jgi:hypothetical protein
MLHEMTDELKYVTLKRAQERLEQRGFNRGTDKQGGPNKPFFEGVRLYDLALSGGREWPED